MISTEDDFLQSWHRNNYFLFRDHSRSRSSDDPGSSTSTVSAKLMLTSTYLCHPWAGWLHRSISWSVSPVHVEGAYRLLHVRMAFCSPIPAKVLDHRRSLLSTKPQILYGSRKRRRTTFPKAPKAIVLPPAPILLVLTGASTHRFIPQTVRGPPAAFLATALLANLSLLPADASVYATLIDIAPVAVCLLLLQPPLAKAQQGSVSELRQLLMAFVVGAVGTTIGAILAGLLCPLEPREVWCMAAAFAATYIGGSVNYVGIVRALDVPKDMAAAGLAADLSAMAVYFAGLFALASRVKIDSRDKVGSPAEERTGGRGRFGQSMGLLAVPLVLTACIAVVSRILESRLALPAGSDLLLMSGLSVVIARSRRIQPYLRHSARLGNIAVTAFFASLGATSRLSAVASVSPAVLGVAAVVLGVHAAVMVLIGWGCLRLPAKLLLLASNANIGGASTAAAFAAAFGWRRLIASAVLVGTLGYLVGTPVGLLIFGVARNLISGVS